MSIPRSPRDYAAARGASNKDREMTSTLSPGYQQQRQPSPIRTLCMHRNNNDAASRIQSLGRSRSTGSSTLLLSATSLQNTPRRLSSGSACETCRRRKTKCDGGHPCAYCATNQLECIHRATRRKKQQQQQHSSSHYQHGELAMFWKSTSDDSPAASSRAASLSKQTSCPSLLVTSHWSEASSSSSSSTPPVAAAPQRQQQQRDRSTSPLGKQEIPSVMGKI